MAIGDISLTSSTRANLLALQNTADLLGTTQQRLSTGKKVNSALDNATSYFQSEGFLNSANDLSTLKDSMSTALQTIQSATDAIESITDLVNQLQSIVTSAAQTEDADTRESLATTYNALLTQLDDLADDATFNGTNLVNSMVSSLKINFNATNTTSLTVAGQNLSSAGLGVGSAVSNWGVNSYVSESTMTLTRATSDTSLTNAVYSGTLSGLSVTGATAVTSGDGVVITSTSQNYTDGAMISSTTTATYTALLDGTSGLGQTNVTSTAVSTEDSTGDTFLRVTGQFTATGTSASTFNGTVNSLVGSGTTISIGIGQTVEVAYDDGVTSTVTRYTNNTAAAIEVDLTDATDAVTTLGTLSYNDGSAIGTSSVVVSNSAPGATTAASHVEPTGGATLDVGAADYATIIAVPTGLTAVGTADTGTASTTTANYEITGEFTFLNAGTNAGDDAIVVHAGDSIQVLADTGGGNITVQNYINNSSSDIVINLADDSTIAENGTNTYYANNSTVAYDISAGTVATTGVTLAAGQTLNSNSLVDSLDVAAGGTVTVKQTVASAATSASTTTDSSVTAYDVTGATISGIGASGVRATVSGTGTTTYAGSGLQVSMTSVATLTGSSIDAVKKALTASQDQLSAALSTLRSAASSLGTNNSLVQTREEFTKNMINTLQTASDNLVLADSNEEGANMQTLQAQNSLGVVSLGISGQLAQSVLKLF